MSFIISRLYALPPFVKKKKKRNQKKPPVVENMLYSFLQEKNIYRWHVDILKGNCIRKPNTVVKKHQDMNAMTWNLYELSKLGM